MDDRPCKLAKLTKLRKTIPHTTKASLQAILNCIKDDGCPDLSNAKHMREGCKAALDQFCGYGPLLLNHSLVCKSGQKKTVALVNVLSWLHGAYKAGGGWFTLMKQAMASNQSTLSLVFYADEITPGNVLANVPTRKIWALYMTVKEFKQAMQKEAAWVTVGIIRSSIVAAVDGHLSQIFSALLDSIFNSNSCNVSELGMQLQEPDGTSAASRLMLQLGLMIMDGQASKYCWSTKGDSGSRFCQQCANIFQLADDKDDDEGEDGHLSEVSKFCKFTDLKLVSDSDIFKSWDRLMARHGSIPTQEFKMWEQAAGIAFSPFAVLANQGLRKVLKPTQQNCWGWMHCFLSSGVMSIACYNLLHAIKQWDLLKGYVQQFQLPNHLKTIKLAPLFDDKRVAKHRKHHKMNATASELLTLCTILAHYVLGVCIPANACLEEAQVFFAANEMLDLLQNSWHGIVSPQQLLVAAENCLQRWKGLGWPMIKKRHWMLHFAQMLKNHACIPNCFCMERKNKVPARIASNIQNLKTFEHSLYSEVLTLEMERISDPDVFASCPALLNSTPLSKKLQPLAAEVFGQLQGAQASNHARIKYGSCSRGDVVYFSSQSANRFDAGQVFAFLCNHENHVCILNSFTLKKQCETFAEWEEGECLEVVQLAHLWVAVTFAKGRNKVTTLTPWAFR